MEAADARERLESMVAASSSPTLTTAEVDQLMLIAARPDGDGLLPDAGGWSGTYDLNAAAAEGWRWKAAKVAGDFTFATDGQTFNRSDMVKACQAMALTYSKRVAGSIPLVARDSEWDTDLIPNVNA